MRKQIKEVKANGVFNSEELGVLLSATEGNSHEALFKTSIYTAMRLKELLDLRWEDIDFENEVITILYKHTTNSPDKIRITEALKQVLIRHKKQQEFNQSTNNLLFTDFSGKRLNEDTIRRNFHRLVNEVNLPNLPFGAVRQSIGLRLLENGAGIHFVSKFLRHRSVTSTLMMYERYLKPKQK